jgi:gas vesicle protein
MRDEIIESYGHLKMAAAQAAGASAEQLTPPYDKARHAATKGWVSTKDAFAPLYETMREGAKNARAKAEKNVSENRRTWPVLVGFLVAGAAIGAAAAMIARRRRLAEQWEEYEPTLDDATDTMKDAAAGKVAVATKKVAGGAAAVADSVSTQAGKLADTLHEKAGTPVRSATDAITDAAGDLADKAKKGAETFAAFADDTADDLVARAEHRH